jgi:hypothetical protein
MLGSACWLEPSFLEGEELGVVQLKLEGRPEQEEEVRLGQICEAANTAPYFSVLARS